MSRRVLWIANAVLVLAAVLLVWRWHQANSNDPLPDRSEEDARLVGELQAVVLSPPTPSPPALGVWPQWRGPGRDGVSPEQVAPWPEAGPPLRWQANLGAGYSAPALVGKRLVTLERVGDEEAVVCLDTETGRPLWRFPYPCSYQSQHGSGPRATPTVVDDLVYTLGASGMLHCLKLADGAIVWRHNLTEKFEAKAPDCGYTASPLVEGDRVIVPPGGSAGRSVAAFQRRTGALAWSSLDDAPGYSSPVAATLAGVRQVLLLTLTRLVALDPATGAELWSFPWGSPEYPNIATPIVVDDYVFISTGYGIGCALLKISKTDGRLHAEKVYANNRMRNHFATSVYHGQHLYGFSEFMLTCMEVRSGKVKWTARGYQKGSLLAAGDQLIVLGEQGKLGLIAADPEKYRELSVCTPVSSKCWTPPVLADGRLYVRSADALLCFDLRK